MYMYLPEKENEKKKRENAEWRNYQKFLFLVVLDGRVRS